MSQLHMEESLLARRSPAPAAGKQGASDSDFIRAVPNHDVWDDDTEVVRLPDSGEGDNDNEGDNADSSDWDNDDDTQIVRMSDSYDGNSHDGDSLDGNGGGSDWDNDDDTQIVRVPDSDEADGGQQVAQAEMAPATNLVDVPVDRPMATARLPERVPAEENFAGADAAGIGRLGGFRGFGRAALRNPLALFPRRLWRGVRSLWSGIKKAWSRRTARRAREREAAAEQVPAAPADPLEAQVPGADPLEAQVPGEGQGSEASVVAEKPPATIAVDPATRYGQHRLAQHQARTDLANYRAEHPGPVQMPPAPQQNMLATLRAGQPLDAGASDYVSAARAKAAELEEQYDNASPQNTANYPFSQRTLADEEHSGAARAGQVITQFGAAINDRDDVMADPSKDPKLAAAQKALNITANLGKSGMKYVDEKLRAYTDSDYKEKIAGTTGKAFVDLQKTGQFYGGFVGKDLANGIDAATDSKAGAHFFKDNPALIPNTWDRVGRNADGSIGFGPGVGPATHVEIMPGSNGGPAWNYDKNVNMLAAGKFLEHPSTIAQAAGTGLTEANGRPFAQAHNQRADLLSRQFQTSVARAMMAANRKAGEGPRPFPNASSRMLQAIVREHGAASALGKPMLREGYSSNFALPFARTANLNDSTHHRRRGIALQKALAARTAPEGEGQQGDAMTREQLMALSPLTWKPRKERDSVLPSALQQATERDEVPGRVVRQREGLERGLAHMGNAVGTTLDVAGGVLAFDGGESDLKEGNLKTAAAKAALSEVYQNGATAGLGYVPGVGKYAKTFGLATLTPAGTGLQKIGKGLKEVAFGKEERDREYNRHWGLVDPYELEDGDMRAHQRWEERNLSGQMDQARKAFADARTTGDAEGMADRRERYLAMMEQARALEGQLGRSRRRALARTGYVERPRAEVGGDEYNTPQVPLTEAQLQSHRERNPSLLSAALPKDVPVYAERFRPAPASASHASAGLEASGTELSSAPQMPKQGVVNWKDPDLFNISEEDEEGELESTGSDRQHRRPFPLIEEEQDEDDPFR